MRAHAGPPPLLHLLSARPMRADLRPLRFAAALPSASATAAAAAADGVSAAGPFLYDPFAARRAGGRKAAEEEVVSASGAVQWACGEVAVVDVEVANPTSVSIRVGGWQAGGGGRGAEEDANCPL